MLLKNNQVRQAFLFLTFICIVTVAGCASTPDPKNVFANPPKAPLPLDEKDLKPGLEVLYFNQQLDWLDWMPRGELARKTGKPGPPVSDLDYWSKEDGEVFDSGRMESVAMEMSGFILLEQPGLYLFQANSNDGIRVYINDHLIIDDSEVHADHLSDEAPFEITEPGWYWFGIRYFQKAHSARLQLYWKTPGANSFEIIPPQVLAHMDTD